MLRSRTDTVTPVWDDGGSAVESRRAPRDPASVRRSQQAASRTAGTSLATSFAHRQHGRLPPKANADPTPLVSRHV
jgi:hypothetical protein